MTKQGNALLKKVAVQALSPNLALGLVSTRPRIKTHLARPTASGKNLAYARTYKPVFLRLSQQLVHVLFVLFNARLTVGINPDQPALHDSCQH